MNKLVRMAYQFIHVEGYARQAGKGKSGRNTVASIIDEAERKPGACPHVHAPRPPVKLYGLSLSEVRLLAEDWAAKSKDARGHALRKDGLCLLGGVVSLPHAMADRWDPFAKATLSWLKKEYGPRLISAISHHDESNPHLHYYVVPKPGERFEAIHDGIRASVKTNPNRGNRALSPEDKALGRKFANLAYREAMRKFQDRFWDNVGKRFGLLRVGPKRQRLSRGEQQAREAEAQRLAEEIGLREQQETDLYERARTLTFRENKLSFEISRLDELKRGERRKGRLEAEATALNSILSRLPKRLWIEVTEHLNGKERER